MASSYKVRVIINPVAGRDAPVLSALNAAFTETSVDWDLAITRPEGVHDAVEAALAAEPSLVLVYGGDGTVAEVAAELLKRRSQTPIGVLAGGTANALAEQLGSDRSLEEVLQRYAAQQYAVASRDVGRVKDRVFLSRLSIGAAAGMTGHVSREQKKALGLLAYALSTFRAGQAAELRTYRITANGEQHTYEAIGLVVACGSGTGLGVSLSKQVNDDPSKLHLFVIPSILSAADALGNLLVGNGLMDGLVHLSAGEFQVQTNPPVCVHADGEDIGGTPLTATLQRAALRFAVPFWPE